MKCPACGYENAPDALSCNLCQGVLVKSTRFPVAPPAGAAAPDRRPRHLLVPVSGAPIELPVGTTFTIGRSPDSGLVVPSGRVSRNHAEVRWEGTRPVLVDKGSSNGTLVRGKPIAEHPLAPGDEIEVGPFFCTYQVERAAALPAGVQASESALGATFGEEGGVMSGRIAANTVGELLQAIELNQKTGTLEAYGPTGTGWLRVKAGAPLAAEFTPKKGGAQVTGNEAVLELLALDGGRFTFEPRLQDTPRTIQPTITGLLLEAGRRRDEAAIRDTDAPT